MNFQEFENKVSESVNAMNFDVLLALMSNLDRIENESCDHLTKLVSKYSYLMTVYSHCRLEEHRIKKAIRDYDYRGGSYHRHTQNCVTEHGLKRFFAKFSFLRHELESELITLGVDPKRFHPHIRSYSSSLAQDRAKIMNSLDKSAPIDYHN